MMDYKIKREISNIYKRYILYILYNMLYIFDIQDYVFYVMYRISKRYNCNRNLLIAKSSKLHQQCMKEKLRQ